MRQVGIYLWVLLLFFFFFYKNVHAVCYVHQVFYSCEQNETYPRWLSSNAHCCLEFTVGKVLNPGYFYFFVCSFPRPPLVGFCLCPQDVISPWVLRMSDQFLWASPGSCTKCCGGMLFLSLFKMFPSLCAAALYEWPHVAVLVQLLWLVLKTEIPKPGACDRSWCLFILLAVTGIPFWVSYAEFLEDSFWYYSAGFWCIHVFLTRWSKWKPTSHSSHGWEGSSHPCPTKFCSCSQQSVIHCQPWLLYTSIFWSLDPE